MVGVTATCMYFKPDQKHTRLVMLQANLVLFEADPASFLESFLTQDECWGHHFEPEPRDQTIIMQWKHPSSPPPKKTKVMSSAGKAMTSIFLDAMVIVFIDVLRIGQTSKVSLGNLMTTC